MNKLESHNHYEQVIKVTETDSVILGHVNNAVYLRWVKDIYVAYWNHYAADE